MDNDSTTIARVKATVNPNIRKKSDSNHTKKGFTGALVELSSTHKALRNIKVRGHIEKCFMYCVQQHQDNPAQLKTGLDNIVPHLYGKRIHCKYPQDKMTRKKIQKNWKRNGNLFFLFNFR